MALPSVDLHPYPFSGDSGDWTPELVGTSRCMQLLRQEVARIARTESSVLITGETGTGKGCVARSIHELSGRAPLVHVDCASLAESVIESELFGHERGSFTGAHDRRVGRFELAASGTLFLDEIGELSPRLQAKLLRVLQDRQYERIGGTRTLSMSARIISATNVDVIQAVHDRTFRGDLYYRLRVVELAVPPLRARLEDVPDLAAYGLRQCASRMGFPTPEMADGFVDGLMSYSWPGNVRELFNVIEAAVIFAEGRRLEPIHLRNLLDGPNGCVRPASWPVPGGPLHLAESSLAAPGTTASAQLPHEIAHVLVETGGNVARAARRLRVARSTLRYQIRKYGLVAIIPRD